MNKIATSNINDKIKNNFSVDKLHAEVIKKLRTIYDPELPVNIYDLKLIYRVTVDEEKNVFIEMTLTTPSCPEAQSLPALVQSNIEAIPEVNKVVLELVWDPPWDSSMLTEDIKMVLGIHY